MQELVSLEIFSPSLFSCPENVICFLRLLQIFKRSSDYMEANIMNPDETAPKQSNLGPY